MLGQRVTPRMADMEAIELDVNNLKQWRVGVDHGLESLARESRENHKQLVRVEEKLTFKLEESSRQSLQVRDDVSSMKGGIQAIKWLLGFIIGLLGVLGSFFAWYASTVIGG